MPTIEVTVSPTGETTLETRGYAGPACREASRSLEQSLGLVLQDQPTSALYIEPPLPETTFETG